MSVVPGGRSSIHTETDILLSVCRRYAEFVFIPPIPFVPPTPLFTGSWSVTVADDAWNANNDTFFPPATTREKYEKIVLYCSAWHVRRRGDCSPLSSIGHARSPSYTALYTIYVRINCVRKIITITIYPVDSIRARNPTPRSFFPFRRHGIRSLARSDGQTVSTHGCSSTSLPKSCYRYGAIHEKHERFII